MRCLRRLIPLLLACMLLTAALAYAEEPEPKDWQIAAGQLLADLVQAYEDPREDDAARIDADLAAITDGGTRAVAEAVTAHWRKIYLDPDYRLLVHGKDDPAELTIPDPAAHAFCVLGYALVNEEMTDELKERCEAAAAAARAFPEAILVCTGGATGENNPERHTEAGLMKDYLTGTCGIAAERIFTDDRAMTTAQNALNTMVILRERGIRTMTVVTSAYHQRRGQVLYRAVAEQYRLRYGYTAEIIGSYCADFEPERDAYHADHRAAASQLADILGIPHRALNLPPRKERPQKRDPGTAEAE